MRLIYILLSPYFVNLVDLGEVIETKFKIIISIYLNSIQKIAIKNVQLFIRFMYLHDKISKMIMAMYIFRNANLLTKVCNFGLRKLGLCLFVYQKFYVI